MSGNEDPKKDGKAEKNAATRFGLEDHEATQQDARVTTLRTEHERRASMQSGDRKKTNSRLMSVNDQWEIPKSPSDGGPSPARPSSAVNNIDTEDQKAKDQANAQDPRIENLQAEEPRQMLVRRSISGTRADDPPKGPPPAAYDADTSESDAGEKRLSSPAAPASAVPEPSPQLGASSETEPDPPEKKPSLKETPTPLAVQPSSTPTPPPPPPPTPPPPPPESPESPESQEKSVDQPPPKERPEDVPLPPPTMMSMSPRNSKTLNAAGSEDDVQSKLTNTDLTFYPSKKFATKGTNTSGMLYSESDSEPEEEALVPDDFPDTDLDKLFLLACREVRAAGEVALAWNEKKESTTKSQEQDLATGPNDLIEDTFIKAISTRFPNHKFIDEDRIAKSEAGMVELTDDPTWVIGPIDGSMNYVHHFPYYCISVAYMVNQQTEFGIIYNPPMKNMYAARRGRGAKVNGKVIKTTGQADLSSALVLQELGSGENEASSRVAMANAQKLAKKTQAMRSIGSPAMGLAMVASGVADAYFNFGLHFWDMAAGVLLVTEAGGVVQDPAGDQLDIMSRRCLAASSVHLALELGSHLEQNYPSPRDDEPRGNPNDGPAPEMRDFTSQTDFPDSESSLTTDAEAAKAH